MGYSVFIIAKDKHLQNKMFSFLDEHFIGFNQFYSGQKHSYVGLRCGVKQTNGISYPGPIKNPLMIGFDFNASGGERTYMFEVLNWMNTKIGKNPKCYYYDGDKTNVNGKKTIRMRFEEESERVFNSKSKEEKIKRPLSSIIRDQASWMLGAYVNGTPAEIDEEIEKRIIAMDIAIKSLNDLWEQK